MAGSAGCNLMSDWYFLGKRVRFFMILLEEVVIVACIRKEVRPQMYIIVKFEMIIQDIKAPK